MGSDDKISVSIWLKPDYIQLFVTGREVRYRSVIGQGVEVWLFKGWSDDRYPEWFHAYPEMIEVLFLMILFYVEISEVSSGKSIGVKDS